MSQYIFDIVFMFPAVISPGQMTMGTLPNWLISAYSESDRLTV
jgi:hypothetical protein